MEILARARLAAEAAKARGGNCIVVGEFAYCQCACHRAPKEELVGEHAAACCHICPLCEQNIAIWAFDSHVLECAANYFKSEGNQEESTA